MIKSCFCVFLSVALFVFLSLSAIAVPPNSDYLGIYSLRTATLSFEDISVSDNFSMPLSFGEFYLIGFEPLEGSSLPSSGSIDFVLDFESEIPFDIYFFSGLTSPEFGIFDSPFLISSLYSYETSSFLDGSILASKIFSSRPLTVSSLNLYGIFGEFDLNAESPFFKFYSTIESVPLENTVLNLRFYGLSGISAGHYKLSISGPLVDDFLAVPFGMFIDYIESDDPVVSFDKGLITFSEASSLIRDNMNTVLDDPDATDSSKQMAIAIADNKLTQLREASDNKFSVVVEQFDSASTSVVNSYINSGSTDVTTAIEALNSVYTDYLTQSTSPEQGVLINTQYSVKLSQLQTVFDVNYKKQLDSVLTDQDMSNKVQQIEKVDSLLTIEDEALTIFDESDYQSQLVFQSWISQFSGDVTAYRSVFDFLFEDSRTSRFQPFLTIPFSLVLVGVLLSTTTAVFRKRG